MEGDTREQQSSTKQTLTDSRYLLEMLQIQSAGVLNPLHTLQIVSTPNLKKKLEIQMQNKNIFDERE